MTELEKGFALLTSHLGNPQRPVFVWFITGIDKGYIYPYNLI